MALSQTQWSLATFAQGDQAVAALEVGGVAYRLAPSLARVGLAGQDSVLGLFSDWARSLTAINAAASQVQASDQITAASRLAPVLYPGKILCAGANYYDHLAALRHAGMPALLFEAGVIVNREEEIRMRDGTVRNSIVTGVAAGIDACLKKDEGGRMKDEWKYNGKDNVHGK